MLINQKNLILGHGIPKEIKIRNNVELPCPERGNTYSKYGFIRKVPIKQICFLVDVKNVIIY